MKKRLTHAWHTRRQEIVLGLFIVLFVAGVVQYALGLRYILPLTPLMLALLAAAALFFWDAESKKKLQATLLVLILGFVVELIGVHTGLLFGDYAYGDMLGLRLAGVPVTIGITWLLVTLSAWQITQYRPMRVWQRFALAGALVVMLDIVLERFAVSYGLWAWQGGEVPLYNYLCWFGISMAMFAIYHKITPQAKPSIYIIALLPLIASFFWVMLFFA